MLSYRMHVPCLYPHLTCRSDFLLYTTYNQDKPYPRNRLLILPEAVLRIQSVPGLLWMSRRIVVQKSVIMTVWKSAFLLWHFLLSAYLFQRKKFPPILEAFFHKVSTTLLLMLPTHLFAAGSTGLPA